MHRHSESVLESRMLFRRQGEERGKKRKRCCTLSLERTFAWQALYIKNQIVRLAGP